MDELTVEQRVAAAYLAGLIDGEGCIKNHINIANTDPGIIAACRECCEILGLTYTLAENQNNNRGTKTIYYVNIYKRAQLEFILAHVPLRSVKRAKLEAKIAAYVDWQPGDKLPVTAAELHDLHWKQRLSAAEIARRFGKNPSGMVYWFRVLGVSKRSHREASELRDELGNGRGVWPSRATVSA